MRGSFSIVLFLILCTTTIANAGPRPQQDWAKLCINRPGEMGRINVEPVTIRLGTAGEFTIHGEEEVCLTAFPDELTAISLRFPYPYGPEEKLRYWETSPVAIAVKPSATTRITLCERNKWRNASHPLETGWHRMWALSPPENPSACGKP
jgi:hypothetical protein